MCLVHTINTLCILAVGISTKSQPKNAHLPPVRVTFEWDGVTKQGALSMSEMSSVADLLQVNDSFLELK